MNPEANRKGPLVPNLKIPVRNSSSSIPGKRNIIPGIQKMPGKPITVVTFTLVEPSMREEVPSIVSALSTTVD